MKQTVEEASCIHWSESTYKEDAELAYDKHECIAVTALARHISLRAFKAGAEWQVKQSPWISVEEQPIPNNEDLVVLLEDGSYRIACSGGESGIQESNTYKPLFNVIAFMLIPTFDQILEANKDVLQRMKEKGD